MSKRVILRLGLVLLRGLRASAPDIILLRLCCVHRFPYKTQVTSCTSTPTTRRNSRFFSNGRHVSVVELRCQPKPIRQAAPERCTRRNTFHQPQARRPGKPTERSNRVRHESLRPERCAAIHSLVVRLGPTSAHSRDLRQWANPQDPRKPILLHEGVS